MILSDHLYPATELPAWLDSLWGTPEVQRLRQVRLVNAASPTIAALSDVRRFSHLLGVAGLATRMEPSISDVVGSDGYRDFLAATVLHDIGTPAFGHLFEYLLNARDGWHHEKMVPEILRGRYSPEGLHHQIFGGWKPRVALELETLRIDPAVVDNIIRGQMAPGSLLASALDIDNVDNVFRMASHLGLLHVPTRPMDLAEAMALDDDGPLVHEWGLPMIDVWRELRRKSYERMLFDRGCLAVQAMLTSAMSAALSRGELGAEHWDLTDEQLLDRLHHDEAVKRFAVGDFFDTVFVGWFGVQSGPDLRAPLEQQKLAAALEDALGYRCASYVYYDSGTMEKRLQLRVLQSGGQVVSHSVGEQSASTVIGVFTPLRGVVRDRRDPRLVREVLSSFGVEVASQQPLPTIDLEYGGFQTQLPV